MAAGPLSGLKVVEYCEFVSGPFCTKMLADLGAEVIKSKDRKVTKREEEGRIFTTTRTPSFPDCFCTTTPTKKA